MNSLKSECVVACVLRGYVEDTTVALDDCTTLNGISISTLVSGIFRTDDKILSRDPQLKFATLNNANPPRFVGGLVSHNKLTSSQGYKVFYSGADGQNLIQGGGTKSPVEDVMVKPGWNWIGHAPLISYYVNSGIVAVSGQFTLDDQIKTRSGSTLTFCTYSGSKFEPALKLKPGVGYEVKVAQAITFRYVESGDLTI